MYNALQYAMSCSSGTVAEVKVLLANSDGQKLAMERVPGVSEDTVHNPKRICISFFLFFLLIYLFRV